MPNELNRNSHLIDADNAKSSRKKLATSTFTASVWTISGVVLVACGNLEDLLGLDDGGGGGGRSLHVQKSPVQGARIYFDIDEDGDVSRAEIAAQDAQYPEGFISDETGRVSGIPADLYGKPFVAMLDGAIDADTGVELAGSNDLHSIPNADGKHILASPITEYIEGVARQTGKTAEEVVAELLGYANPDQLTEAEEAARDELQRMILDPNNYLDGSSGVEALADYLDDPQNPKGDTDVQYQIGVYLPKEIPTDNTLEILNPDTDTSTADVVELPDVTIGAHNWYVAKIDAMSHAGRVRYRFVEADGTTPANIRDFAINERGVISVIEGATPTSTTLYVAVSNDNAEHTKIASVEVTVAATTPTLRVDLDSTTIAENVAAGTELITGITTDITNPKWVIRGDRDLASKFEITPDGGTYNLVLKSGKSLDYEVLNGGVIKLQIAAENNVGVRSEKLELTINVEDANDAPTFQSDVLNRDLSYLAEIAEDTSVGTEIARVGAIDTDADAGDVRYAITAGNIGDAFTIDEVTGAISVENLLDFETTATYTLTITATDGTNPATEMVRIALTDLNDEIPTYTPSGDAEVRIVTASENTADTSIDYRITIADDDADATNSFSINIDGGGDRFEFQDQGNGVWELFLLTGEAVSEPEGSTITLTYSVSDGDNEAADIGSVSIAVIDTSVRFDPIPSTSPIPEATDITTATLGTNSDGVLASVTATSTEGEVITYTLDSVMDDAGNAITGLFEIDASSGAITFIDASVDLDYEAISAYTLTITASAPRESGSTEIDTNTATITINIDNAQEGDATYMITGNIETGATLEALLAEDGADADGVVGTPSYRWFIKADGTADPSGIDDADTDTFMWLQNRSSSDNTYTISDNPRLGWVYGVAVSYLDGFHGGSTPQGAPTFATALATMEIEFAEAIYTGSINEDNTFATMPAITASVTRSTADNTILYEFVTDADTGTTAASHLGFTIDGTGAISFTGTAATDLDYDTAPDARDSITLTVRASYDADGTGPVEAIYKDVDVEIAVGDVNDNAPVYAPLQIESAPFVRPGFGTAESGSPTNGADTITGTSAAEYFKGGAGNDIITSGGGNDHIMGGTGNDEITLSEARGSVETIYYSFRSTDSGAWVGVDGSDNIYNFRRGEDKLVLLDTDGSLISLGDFLDDANVGGSKLSVKPLLFTKNYQYIYGVEIIFGSEKLIVNYHEDDNVLYYSVFSGRYQDAAADYIGALDSSKTNGAGYNKVTKTLTDNTLLENYFGSGDHDNLIIRDEGYLVDIVTDVFISENRDSTDGVFATLAANDGDGSDLHGKVTYSITGGTGMGLFTIDENGGISVASTATFDYSTAASYTLTIEAADGSGVGADTITSDGSIEHIFGGIGDDTITLSADAGNVETIYYRFTSTDSGAWVGVDGTDTIHNFRRGEDRIVLLDTDGSVISLTDFLSAGNVAPNKLQVKPVLRSANPQTLYGVEIIFGGEKLTINYHEDDQVYYYEQREQYSLTTGLTTVSDQYQPAAAAYLGTGISNPAGYDKTTNTLTDNTLLQNYFGTGSHNNLQILDDADLAGIAPHISISNPPISDTILIGISENIAPEFAPLQVTDDPEVLGSVVTFAGITANTETISGTAAAEYINGGGGVDTINGGGGRDHIVGGAGNDVITLSQARGSVETIYYRFKSTDNGAWVGVDGSDTIYNFRRGEDKLVLLDTDNTPISLAEFLDDANVNGSKLVVKPLLLTKNYQYIYGVEIIFGSEKLIINYHEDDKVLYYSVLSGRYQDAAADYIGALDSSNTNGAGYNKVTKTLTDNTLLLNYFGLEDHNNLIVLDDARLADVVADVFITEDRTYDDGVFATLAATDTDGPNPVSYSIIAGNTDGVFEIDENGGISVADGKSLNYEAITGYTLTIGASDGTDTSTKDILVNIQDVNDVAPTFRIEGIDVGGRHGPSIGGSVLGGTHSVDMDTGASVIVSDADSDYLNDIDVIVTGDNERMTNRWEFRRKEGTDNVFELFLLAGAHGGDPRYWTDRRVNFDVTDGDFTISSSVHIQGRANPSPTEPITPPDRQAQAAHDPIDPDDDLGLIPIPDQTPDPI